MIITKRESYTKEEIAKMREIFDIYIKIVIDLNQKTCSAGCDRHFESEKILMNQGSQQTDLWGGGIDIETRTIDCNSMINLRPQQGNSSNEILDAQARTEFERLTRDFFKEIYGQ